MAGQWLYLAMAVTYLGVMRFSERKITGVVEVIKSRIFLVALCIVFSSTAEALTWDDLWLNPDEQGYKALQQNDLQQAATEFNSPEWQGIAYYRLKEYKKALEAFSKGTDATAFYNSGNALALLGRYKEAIAAYDKALALNTSFDDARFNRDLLKKLLNSQPPSAPTPQMTPPFKQNYKNKQNQSQSNSNNNQQQQTGTSQNNSQQQNQQQNQQQQQQLNQQQPANSQTTPVSSNPTSYQDQQQQQALQNINDDPGGLLQRKLQRDYEQRSQQGN
jgi:Ca-activated chloride channel family protein